MQTVRQLLLRFVPEAPYTSNLEKLRAAAAALLAIALTTLICEHFVRGPQAPVLILSMGASAVLLFAVPSSPLAQPWPFMGGNLVSGLIGISCAHWLPHGFIAQGLAVGLAVLAMHSLRCIHPPGGATALSTVMGAGTGTVPGFEFLLTPIALNLVVMLTLALIVNNLLPGRHYPSRRAAPNPHQSDDLKPMDRVGFRNTDIDYAVRKYNQLLDVSRNDLETVLHLAETHAYRRQFGEVLCADIMSRDLVTAEFGTELEEVWAQLRLHKIGAIPVIDRARRVVGIISLIDILKRADLRAYKSFDEKLKDFIRRTPDPYSNKPEVVGQVMATQVTTVRENSHIAELVPLLSDRGLHHVPVVNAENRLVGMITQSDLIAALYRSR